MKLFGSVRILHCFQFFVLKMLIVILEAFDSDLSDVVAFQQTYNDRQNQNSQLLTVY